MLDTDESRLVMLASYHEQGFSGKRGMGLRALTILDRHTDWS